MDKLTASDGAAADHFGYSVAISGDTAIIAAYHNDDNGFSSGSAYIFRDDGNGNWIQIDKLLPDDGAELDFFGFSVAISPDGIGTTAIVGARLDDDNGPSSGSAYIFRDDGNGNWIQMDKLTASDGAAADHFGYSVAISGATAIVGARSDDDNGFDSGSANIFRDDGNGNWIQIDKLLPDDGAQDDFFGGSVAISGHTAVVGARGDDFSGAAYLFDTTTGVQIAKLLADDGAAGDSFGWPVAISGPPERKSPSSGLPGTTTTATTPAQPTSSTPPRAGRSSSSWPMTARRVTGSVGSG